MAMVEIQATKNAETYMCTYITDKCIIIDNLNPVYNESAYDSNFKSNLKVAKDCLTSLVDQLKPK